jgi:hypothetical protein
VRFLAVNDKKMRYNILFVLIENVDFYKRLIAFFLRLIENILCSQIFIMYLMDDTFGKTFFSLSYLTAL